MEEASVLGNRIGIVSNGKLKCCGTGLFLIDKFGKFISLTIAKEKNANDDEIIEFLKTHINNLEHEILSEEILVKIPKHDKINLKEFFAKLDEFDRFENQVIWCFHADIRRCFPQHFC
jgi:ATP-binding cassette subfamily A (ABC1) protein 3